ALVVVDPTVLSTLPRREFRAGLYEVIKYGMIASRPLFDRVASTVRALFHGTADALLPVVSESCGIKASIVEQDELETGLRRLLHFGHTAGLAREAWTKSRRFRHGEAVGYGMLVAAEIAVRRGTMPEADRLALREGIATPGPRPARADASRLGVLRAD